MELMKGYKQTDVGVIPEEWDICELSQLTSLMTNGFVGTVKSEYTESDEGVTYIQGYNVEENTFNFRGIKKVTKEFHKRHLKSSLKEGDILTIQTGDVGLTTIVPKELVGSNCHALIISRFKKDKCHPKYFSYYLNSNEGRSRLKEIEIGTTMKHINVSDMLRFLVPVPPKLEQTYIASVLSDTDDYIISIEKHIEKKRQIKQGAMQELLKPKEGWELFSLGNLVEINKGQLITDSTRIDGDIPVIAGGKKPAYFHNKPNRSKNTITISGSGASAGYVSFHNYPIFASDCSTIEENNKISIHFIYYFLKLNQEKIYKMQTGGAQPHIHPSDIKPLQIAIPNKEMQSTIAKVLIEMDNELSLLEFKLQKAKSMKQGMMQNLLTGKIRLL